MNGLRPQGKAWVGVTKAPFVNFSIVDVFILDDYPLHASNHIHIWQMSPQPSCGDTCQIWTRYLIANMWFDNVGKITERRKLFSHHVSRWWLHYYDVRMGTTASQITSLTIVYSTVYSDANQRKHQSSASLAFVRGIHRGPVNSPHKWPVTRKMFPFDDVIMWYLLIRSCRELQTIRKNPFCFQNCPEKNTTIRSVVAVITNKGRTNMFAFYVISMR